MPGFVEGTLKKLIKDHGESLCSDINRLKGFLYDACSSYRKEVNVLILVVQEGLIAELKKGGLSAVYVHSLSSRLYNATGIDTALAEWSLRAWSEALGLELPSDTLLRANLIPIVSQAILEYEEGGNIRGAAQCAIALKDKLAATRLLPKVVNARRQFIRVAEKDLFVGRLAILVGDNARAIVIMQDLEAVYNPAKSDYHLTAAAQLAVDLQDATTARRLMRRLENNGLIEEAVQVAVRIRDQETMLRILQAVVDKGRPFIDATTILKLLAPFYPELWKKIRKLLEGRQKEDDDDYNKQTGPIKIRWISPICTAGEIAAALGDKPTAYRIIKRLTDAHSYNEAATIAGIAGDIVLAEELLWEDKKNRKNWSYSLTPWCIARFNPEASYRIIKVLEQKGYDIGVIAARILEVIDNGPGGGTWAIG